ncbi:5-methyltetrahydropteroyltriglutamate--homocysteine S-methyltransferase [Roseomonas sp. OT10]|uniref:5-methyltetrahydropteroyltriglutamate-- homocysteine S-methyltransferase n=1 Tax=Roseomonas cutis TaxID=2897332 RepID=UPI001E562D71|nr:5-methyltetrahydropteroyltriglutamate--homocysteine S-methyltransferase [Roseomonas sp. OT10]UFN47066.1 5-methyltetrahydropteroyltriglutamate--homocysteine S-methyltransferase [Roseomonas sp. OT10]
MSHSDVIDRPPAARPELPPFRAHHVGSLLRPPVLRDARKARAEGRISAGELREVEDAEIDRVIAKQEEVGLRAVTDGEFRRAYWHYDFLGGLEGIEIYEPQEKVQFEGATLQHKLRVNGRIAWKPTMIDDYLYTASRARHAIPKQTIPSPSVVHFRGGRQAIDRSAYPDLDAFFDDLGQAYEDAVRAFAAAGCPYLQLDEVNIAYLCDPRQIEGLKQRGEHVEGLLQIYADMINRATAARPPGMAMSMHLCRGNFKSTFIASGGYEPVAEVLFNQIDIDAYFMEYDDERSGGFEPLRFVPRGKKVVVLGIVTSKTGALESKDELKRRIEAAAKHLPLEQLAISPQCGFASTEEGNRLTEQQQWDKLRLCVEVSEEVWGKG